jgi:hypothetical protein
MIENMVEKNPFAIAMPASHQAAITIVAMYFIRLVMLYSKAANAFED